MGPVAYSCRYDAHPTRFVLAFDGRPDGQVPKPLHEILTGRGFRYHRATRTWRGPAASGTNVLPLLEAAGVPCSKAAITIPPTRRDLQAAEEAAALAREDTSPGAAAFDWDGFPDWCAANLVIKDKRTGRFVPFVLTPIQRKFVRILGNQWKVTKRIRAIVLKHRQPGVSSVVQAIAFKLTLEVQGVEALAMAHDDKGVDAIFRRTKVFRDECPTKLEQKFSNRKEIEYTAPHRSAIRVNVAGEEGFGRGDTRQFVHLSELAFWKRSVVEDILLGVLNSVPDADGTMVIMESTANGATGEFYMRWKAAEQNESEYAAIFFSWLEDETCDLPGESPNDARFATCPVEWREDEPALKARGARPSQLAWRLHMIANKSGGSLEKFKQEQPSTPEEAFISSGRPVFPPSITFPMHEQRKEEERRKPAKRYTIDVEGRIYEDLNGNLRVWKEPEKDVPYLVTADVARGVAVDTTQGDGVRLGDYSTAGVYDEYTKEEVAVWHGRIDPDLFGEMLCALGRRYNEATVCPEANHYGVICVKAMVRMGYSRIYRKEQHDKPTGRPVRQEPEKNYMELGWWTGAALSKLVMLANLNQMIREEDITIYEPEAWAEMKTFVRAPDGTMNAESGCYDDRVMRLAIGATLLMAHPKVRPAPVEVVEPFSTAYFLGRVKERQRRERANVKGDGDFT